MLVLKQQYFLSSLLLSTALLTAQPDTRPIGKVTYTQLAITLYAPEIPVPSGPYKLGGLPGLILEARSLDGAVRFLFDSLEIGENTRGEIKMPDGKDIQKTIKQYWDDIDDKNNKFIEMAKTKGVEMFFSKIESIELNWEN